LCEYKSTKFIRVKNPRLVTVYYGVILILLIYIIVYTVWYDKGYQSFDAVIGTTSIKIKGTGSQGLWYWRNTTIYDAMDLVVPSTEQNAFFLTTSNIITPNQTRGLCSGVQNCTFDNDCEDNLYDSDSQGIFTGVCDVSTHFCQLYGWCPLEIDSDPQVMNNIGNFTVFVKIDIEFPAFDVSRTNTIDRDNSNAPIIGYNLFTIDQILGNATNGNLTNYKSIAQTGAIILMTSSWNCDLDYDVSKCNPSYKFKRIDNELDSISPGYNFRTVDYNVVGDFRMLRKLYGVRVVFVTEGSAGKFSFAALTVTFGAGIAYLGIASFITDIVLERFLTKSDKYEALKNEHVDDDLLSRLFSQHDVQDESKQYISLGVDKQT